MEESSLSIPDWVAKQVLSMTDDAIYVTDKDLNIVAANEVIEKWSKKNGFTDSIAGKHIKNALPFIDQKAISDVQKVIETAIPISVEYVWPIEQNIVVMVHIMPVYTQDEDIQAITIARSLGDQKRIIDGIIKRELAARLLLEQATDGIHIYTTEGTLLYANMALSSRLGYTPEEFVKLQLLDIDISADRERFPHIHQEMLAKGRLLYETAFITKDNQKLTTEVNSSIVQYFGEKAILSISRDVTERRTIINGLTRGLANLVEAQNVARVGSWDWRIEEDTYEWSSGIYDILELDHQAVNQETIYDYIYVEDIDRIRNATQKSFDNSNEFNEAFRLKLNDGSQKVVRGVGRVICNAQGKVVRFFGTITDITEMHAIRNELERTNLDLELYASFLQHDLRSDLHIVMAQAELSKLQESDSSEEAKALNVIQAAAERMSKLLDMFALSTAVLKRNIVSMLHLAADDAKTLNPDLQVDVVNETGNDSVHISAGRLLPLVWINLLRNSANFAGSNAHVGITISSDKKHVYIDVADNGTGVSKSIKHKLFEKGASTTGSGYGLYLCRKIIEAYGGTIELVDQKHKGATFRVVLLSA